MKKEVKEWTSKEGSIATVKVTSIGEEREMACVIANPTLKDLYWEYASLAFNDRKPTYEEMSQFKDELWGRENIAIQVYPGKSEYVNILQYTISLCRSKLIPARQEARLRKKILKAYEEAIKNYSEKKKSMLLSGETRVVAVFGGNKWPSWDEVYKVKDQYWKPEEEAVQFYLSYNEDMNKEHIILLWDAEDMLLP